MKDKIVDVTTELAGSGLGALAGAGVGAVVAGPLGIAGGAMAGTVIGQVFAQIGKEIKERILSKSEDRKIETVYICAKEKINAKLADGYKLRNDDFFDYSANDRSSAEEILEGTLFAAQRECEERKIPYMANLFANISFNTSIDRHMANQFIKIASDLTYRQLVILAVIWAYKNGRLKNTQIRTIPFNKLSGSHNISILSEIQDLYRRNLIFSKEVILSLASIIPAMLEVRGLGANLLYYMELMPLINDEIAKNIIKLLSDTTDYSNIQDSTQSIETEKLAIDGIDAGEISEEKMREIARDEQDKDKATDEEIQAMLDDVWNK